ncbi:hypothetical protein NQ176_g3249 [Zarea fungicola]|uniref:Uncharacterized protein n=1 Tax=Zarea fungicola TaxID=93591 RepID=A0ACC1NKI0_9HYPO|nr:hypothetical protein NQ176_g3249 [Lecanicillium fungicola]
MPAVPLVPYYTLPNNPSSPEDAAKPRRSFIYLFILHNPSITVTAHHNELNSHATPQTANAPQIAIIAKGVTQRSDLSQISMLNASSSQG